MKKKAKYIISISLVILIMCLGITTLILALVPVVSNDHINKPNKVYIYTDSVPSKVLVYRDTEEDKDYVINDIFNLLNKGLEQKVLSALFKGELGKGLETNNNLGASSGKINKNYDTTESYTIVFYYNANQKLVHNNYTKEYNHLFFEVTKNGEYQEVTFGVNTSDGGTSDSISYTYSYKGKMKTLDLYNYVYNIDSKLRND